METTSVSQAFDDDSVESINDTLLPLKPQSQIVEVQIKNTTTHVSDKGQPTQMVHPTAEIMTYHDTEDHQYINPEQKLAIIEQLIVCDTADVRQVVLQVIPQEAPGIGDEKAYNLSQPKKYIEKAEVGMEEVLNEVNVDDVQPRINERVEVTQ